MGKNVVVKMLVINMNFSSSEEKIMKKVYDGLKNLMLRHRLRNRNNQSFPTGIN